jgi:predicted dehydrogenase/aryl-alcohol dehydrogenase-like predicted oxidoreductase
MSDKLQWGIIGTGRIAATFARALSGSRTGAARAVASRSADTAAAFAAEHNLDRHYAGYEALLADRDVEAVYISTPHPMHAEWAIRAAEAGKHVLCEKPLALNHAEAMAIVEAAAAHEVFLMEAFMYRCHPQTARLVELLRAGAIGKVRMLQATFSFHAAFDPASRLFNNQLGGGGILDVGCYVVSMSRLIAGAASGRDFADPLEVAGAAHLGASGVDEYAAAVLLFPGDIIAQVATGVALNQENVVRIHGDAGRILLPNPWQAGRAAADVGRILLHPKGRQEPQEILVETRVNAFVAEADVVGDAVRAGRRQAPPPAMSWEDSLGNMRALDQWRHAVGMVYDSEKPGNIQIVDRRPLLVRNDHNMKYGRIAGVDKPVSRLVMGVDNQRTLPHAAVMFDDFFARGGNCFDTAFGYGGGACERVLGQWVNTRGLREQVVILTKGAHTPYCYPEIIGVQLAESLQRLGADHVDIYMMHRDNPAVPVGEFMDALNEQLAAGRVRAFGVSNWTIPRIEAANEYARQKGLTALAAISNNFSLARMVQPVWAGCVAASDSVSREWLVRTQTPLMPWSSQARGFFTERAAPDKQEDRDLVRCWYSEDNFRRKQRVNELAARRGVLPINIALAWVLCQPFPTFPLIGPRTLAETRTSLPALDIVLDPDQLRWLNLED